MLLKLIVLVTALYGSVASSQAQGMAIGSTSDDVAKVYGAPVGFLWHGVVYPEPPVTVEPVYVIYRYKGYDNEFEYRLTYETDNSQSRLHPTFRVSSIIMIADKPVVVREMLNRLNWAKQLCARGCKVRREVPGRQLLITQKGLTQWASWTIQAYWNQPSGEPIANAMHDLDSQATMFILSQYDYSTMPLTRGVKGDWLPAWPGAPPL